MSTLTTHQKSDIDKLWTEFWTGGITNPLTVIEQISFLMFARLLDVMETTGERRAERTKKPFTGRFEGRDDPRRWKNFKQKDATEMLRIVRDEVFPHFRKLNGGTTFGEYMQDAQLMIQKPNLLVSAVNMIDKLPIPAVFLTSFAQNNKGALLGALVIPSDISCNSLNPKVVRKKGLDPPRPSPQGEGRLAESVFCTK
jgi:hypothetical protein